MIFQNFRFRFFLLIITGGFIFAGMAACHQNSRNKETEKPEILIYCGITMIKPMTELKEIFEKQEHCNITITKGGSGNLMNAFLDSKVGDLYLPGSDSYFVSIFKDYPGVITDSVFVGYNKAAIMVQKGNPKNIGSDLMNFTKKEYAVVIGNPSSGSIGKETYKILQKRGIFDQVEANALKLTTDSKDLIKVLRENQADLVINWYATATWESNAEYVDVIPIDSKYAEKNRLVLGLLKYSKNKEIAKKFMSMAASEKGHEIFRKYGLYDVQ